MLGGEGGLEAAGPGGQAGERDDLVAGVPADGGAAVDLGEQLSCDPGADAFGGTVRRPGPVGAEPGPADEVSEQRERGPGCAAVLSVSS